MLTLDVPGEKVNMLGRAMMEELQGLLADGRVQRDGSGRYRGEHFIIPLHATKGWEGAFLDHFHALVRTLCARLQADEPGSSEHTGGATYTFEVWSGHPEQAEVMGTLSRVRRELTALRERVDSYNARVGVPRGHDRVVCYAGQHVSPQASDLEETNNS